MDRPRSRHELHGLRLDHFVINRIRGGCFNGFGELVDEWQPWCRYLLVSGDCPRGQLDKRGLGVKCAENRQQWPELFVVRARLRH
jgi:hypothetical protein